MLAEASYQSKAERRSFQRETIEIPFLYNTQNSHTLLKGEWKEGSTLDIGPALFGGMSFYTDESLEIGRSICIALYIDLEKLKSMEFPKDELPGIHTGQVLNVLEDDRGKKIVVLFTGYEPDGFEIDPPSGCSVLSFE